MAALLAVFLFAGGCSHGLDDAESAEDILGEAPETGSTDDTESTEDVSDEPLENISIPVSDLDFAIRQSPVDTDRYDAWTDGIYKDAFLKAITDQTPIQYRDKKGTVSYRQLLSHGEELGDEEFLRAVRHSDYFYQDFDGDGLPELTIDTEGPCVLKYYPEEDQMELYHRKEPGWRLLGAGQMYAEFVETTKVGYRHNYHYESVDRASPFQKFSYRSNEIGCHVTVHGQEYTVTDEERAAQLIQAYFEMTHDAPHPMTFAQLFGDGEGQGYLPGEKEPPCFLPEETAPLPLNEERGEEWEMYKSMMEGDFSLVEDERWSILQYYYEKDLEHGDGRCSWSYLLMDFDQDGTKELVIRCYPDVVNTTAYLRYEDGHIKMWGSFISADPHYYTVPLINGRILGIDWYGDDRTWYISRPAPPEWGNSKIEEKHYSKKRPDSSQEHLEEETWYYEYQDYYSDGDICGPLTELSPEEWHQVEDMVEGLMIPEEAWKPCSVFTPKKDRPEIW